MIRYICQFLCFGALALTTLFSTSGYAKGEMQNKNHTSKHEYSSSSSSSDCRASNLPNAAKIKAPPYISSKNDKPVMHVGVINRTSLISPELLDEVLRVVKKQVDEDFAPFYGIHVSFKVFEDQDTVDWSRNVPLIIDDLLPVNFGAFIAFHDLQETPRNGNLITNIVFNAPVVPIGTPYIVVPMGNPSTSYGVVPYSLLGDPTLPPTFASIFSYAVSHEILETLYNYTINKFFFNTIGFEFVDAYFTEVCDPVELSPGYVLCGLNVSNFVLPSYWVNDLVEGPFDFLDTVKAPLTPFAGLQTVYEFSACGGEIFTITSLPPPFGDPTMLIVRDDGPMFAPCPCDDLAANEIKEEKEVKEEATLLRKPGIKKACLDHPKSNIHVLKPAGVVAKELEQKLKLQKKKERRKKAA